MRRLSLNRSQPAKKSGHNIPKNRCRTTVPERMVETLAELPFIGDQVVCLSHDQAAPLPSAGDQRLAAPVIGSIRLGSLFRTLPTRALTGQHVISSVGCGASSALSCGASAGSPPSQAGRTEGFKITGIRL
jgi:hypothetical protein